MRISIEASRFFLTEAVTGDTGSGHVLATVGDEVKGQR
jgi:hypothetical protein